MQIKVKTFNALSVVAGLVCTAAVWHHMATNPRWEGDKGPGVGKMPRQIVAGFIKKAYDEGKGTEAAQLYMDIDNPDKKLRTRDLAKDAIDRQDGPPIPHTIKRIVAEGLNVMVWHCIEPTRGQPATEVIELFKTRGGRIVERLRPAVQPVAGDRCPPPPESKFTGIK